MNTGAVKMILKSMVGGTTSSELAVELDIPYRNVSAILSRLAGDGRVVRSSEMRGRCSVYYRNKRRWSPREDAVIRAMAGRDVADVAARLARTKWAVLHRAHALGVSIGRDYRHWTTGEIRQLCDMASSPARVIAKRLGRTKKSIVDQARATGIKLAPDNSGKWSASTVRRARKLRADGEPLSRISAYTGVPQGTLRHWIYRGVRA